MTDDRILNKFVWELLNRKSDGEPDERTRVLHLSKPLRQGVPGAEEFGNAISQIVGVEAVRPATPYSLTILIGRCFDVRLVVADIEAQTARFLSDLVLPNANLQIVK